jgi:hypothetical protein
MNCDVTIATAPQGYRPMKNTDAHKNISSSILTEAQKQEAQKIEGTVTPQSTGPHIEDQLAHIITSAREVAVVAEELLREFSARETINGSGSGQQMPHAIALAPRLIAATQQQLVSLLAMLRTV